MSDRSDAGGARRLLALAVADRAGEIRTACREAGIRPEVAGSVSEAMGRLAGESWDAVLFSFAVDGVDVETLRTVVEEGGVERVLATAPGASLELALDAERAGVEALLREPLDPEELARALRASAPDEVDAVPLPEPAEGEETRIVGSSEPMADVFRVVARVAESSATVLIRGESGTGKELVARTIHRASDRSDGSFVAVNCAAIPEHLLESELFGHEKGAFTGAVGRKKGRFERADGGTLFLDEIGDMSLVLQAKILRALEEQEIERLGGEGVIPVDTRVLAATNHPLAAQVESGDFREDLYYRLAVVELELAPLRERDGDIRELALHFAALFARRYGRPARAVSEDALARLRSYPWPGNVRELRNVMDRAVLLTRGPVIRADALRLGEASPRGSPVGGQPRGGYPPDTSLDEVEARHIARVLEYTGGHMGDAAEILGIHRNTLTRKVREYGIDPDEPRGG